MAMPVHDGPDPLFAEIVRIAEELDLTSLPPVLSDLLGRAQREGISYSEMVRILLATEANARRERKMVRGLKRSRLGNVEGMEGFDYSIRAQIRASVIQELLLSSWVPSGQNVICLGGPGLGKTRVIKALAHAAWQRGHSVLYAITADVLEELRASRTDGTLRRVLRRYVKPSVLCLDEFGYQGIGIEATDHLFRLVSARHRKASTLIAANTGFRQWKSFFPSEVQAQATVDRLVDDAIVLRFTGKSGRPPREIHGAPLPEE